MAWEDVRREMVEEKGLPSEVADRIGQYVKLNGGIDLVEKLKKDARLVAVESAKSGLEEMSLFLEYCQLFQVDKVQSLI